MLVFRCFLWPMTVQQAALGEIAHCFALGLWLCRYHFLPRRALLWQGELQFIPIYSKFISISSNV